MLIRFLSKPLFALALALASFGCSKDAATPPTSGTGSYKRDGYPVNCTANVTTYSAAGDSIDYLFVHLTTTPQPAAGQEYLIVEYSKTKQQPASAYHPSGIVYSNGQPPVLVPPTSATGPSINNGGYSGTFFGSDIREPLFITDGVFTDARL